MSRSKGIIFTDTGRILRIGDKCSKCGIAEEIKFQQNIKSFCNKTCPDLKGVYVGKTCLLGDKNCVMDENDVFRIGDEIG